MRRNSLLIITALLLFTSISSSIPYSNCLEEFYFVKTYQTLADAERAVGNAYEMIMNADNAGANITGLVEQLNGAVKLLDEARRIYGTNQTYAEELANQAREIADGVFGEALVLLAETQSGSSVRLVLALLGIGGIIVFIGMSLYYSWRRMAQEEEKEILEMEVSTPEEGDGDAEG